MRSKLPVGSGITVASVGTAGDGTPPPDQAVRVMDERGLDIDGRPSRPVEVPVLEGADLVVTMARQHLVDVGAMCPSALDRSFTLMDLLDRARQAGGRGPRETLAQWARRMSAGRAPASVLSLPSSGDVPDPIGRPLREFEVCLATLDRATSELVSHICPGATPVPPAAEPPRRGVRAWLRGSR